MINSRNLGDGAYLPSVFDRYATIRVQPDRTAAALTMALPDVQRELAKFAAKSGVATILNHQSALAEVLKAASEQPAKVDPTLGHLPPRPQASSPRLVGLSGPSGAGA